DYTVKEKIVADGDGVNGRGLKVLLSAGKHTLQVDSDTSLHKSAVTNKDGGMIAGGAGRHVHDLNTPEMTVRTEPPEVDPLDADARAPPGDDDKDRVIRIPSALVQVAQRH